MTTTLTAIPDAITAGDSLDATLSYADYLASQGWSLALALRGPTALDKALTASGDSFTLALTAADTAALTEGLHRWSLRATNAGAVKTADAGILVVEPDITAASAGDLTSYAERMLAICRTARENILAGEMTSYMIDGSQVQMHTLDQVAREEARWLRALATERRGGAAFSSLPVAFCR